MTHSGYYAQQSHAHGTFDKSMSSTAADFRNLTPLVLMSALQRAGTVVCEPMHRFRLEIPADTFGSLVAVLARLRASRRRRQVRGSSCVLEGEIPAAQVHDAGAAAAVADPWRGRAGSAFDHYQPVRGTVPSRPRTDHNPLDRKAYLLHVIRRV